MELTHEQISEFILKATSNSDGFNQLIEVILNSLMHHERRMFLDESSDSGNGFRPRRFCYGHYEFRLKVPRTRQGSFYPVLLAVIKREDEECARLFTSLYSKGLTTEQIGEVAEELYGKHYSKQQVSYLSRSCAEEVEAWLNRELANRYLAVFIDATFSPTRREDSVHREAYYTFLGLLPDGRREVLGIVNHPTEGAINWKEELLNRDYKRVLKMRGAMPSPQAVLFLLGEVARSKTETTYSKKLPYISEWLEEEDSKQ